MKEKLKPMSQAFVKNALGLDGIIEALTRTAPVPPIPPGPDPMDDPENTVFVMRDGTKKVLTNIIVNEGKWDEESPGYEKDYLFLYFDGSETPAESSMYTDVVGMKLGTQFETYQYNTSGTTIFCPIEGATGGYESCDFSGLQWVKFEHIGNIEGLPEIYAGEAIHINGLSQLTSIEFPPSADGNVRLADNSGLSAINHPNGQIFGDESYYIFDGCSNLTAINLPSSGFVKTNFDSPSYSDGFPTSVSSMTIPANLTFDFGKNTFANQKEITFEGRTMAQVKALPGYIDEDHESMFGTVSETSSEYGDPDPLMTLHCSDGDIPLYQFIP